VIIEKGYTTVLDRVVEVRDTRSLEEKYAVVPDPVATVFAWVQLAVATAILFLTVPSIVLYIWAIEFSLIALFGLIYVFLTLNRKIAWKRNYLSAILSGAAEDNA